MLTKFKKFIVIAVASVSSFACSNPQTQTIIIGTEKHEISALPTLKKDGYCFFSLIDKKQDKKFDIASRVINGKCEADESFIILHNFINLRDAFESIKYFESLIPCIVGRSCDDKISLNVIGDFEIMEEELLLDEIFAYTEEYKQSYSFFTNSSKNRMLNIVVQNIGSDRAAVKINSILY